MAIIAARLLALSALAALAAIQLRPGSPATGVPAPIAVAAPWTGTCRSDVAGCVPEAAFASPAGAGAPNSPSYTYPAVYGDDEGVSQGGAGSARLTSPRVQHGLYATRCATTARVRPATTAGPAPTRWASATAERSPTDTSAPAGEP